MVCVRLLCSAYVQPFNGVVEHNGKLVQAGIDLPTVMKQVMDDEGVEVVGKAFFKPLKDYRAAVTDTFIQTAKNIHKKKFFDDFADSALKNGNAFRSVDEARAKGIPTQNLTQINSEFDKSAAMLDSKLLQSKLFTQGSDGGGLLMTPELANAVKGVDAVNSIVPSEDANSRAGTDFGSFRPLTWRSHQVSCMHVTGKWSEESSSVRIPRGASCTAKPTARGPASWTSNLSTFVTSDDTQIGEPRRL